MPRLPRLQFANACYHIYHRGNRRERIFWNDQDYARFESIMIEAMNWSGVQLYSWSLMPNHFHLLVETPDGNIAEFMQRLLTRYAKYFNRVHHFIGHVFQGRYGAIVCDKESYFLELIRYIQLNPYRTMGKPLARLGEWKWASHRYLMMPESQWPGGLLKAFTSVLQRFSDNFREARKRYVVFLAEGLSRGGWEDFYQLKDKRFLGKEEFLEKVTKRHNKDESRIEKQYNFKSTLRELAQALERLSGQSAEVLAGSSRKKGLNVWRKAFVRVGRTYLRLPVKDLANYLGRDATAVSQILRRQAREAQDGREVEMLLEGLKA